MTVNRSISRVQERSQDLAGDGGQELFFTDLEICMSQSNAFGLEGSGGMLPRAKFLKWCNLVRYGIYLDQIVSLNFFKIFIYLCTNFKNYHFLYKKYFRYTLAIG